MPPPGPVSPTLYRGTGASVVVVVVGATVVVVGATVDFRVIVWSDVFAGYLPDLAIFNVNVHDAPVPIVNFVGLLVGDKVHEPVFDHVFTPFEFVEATADRFFSCPADKDDTFHVTVVFVAAATELAVTPPTNPATTNTTTTARPRTPRTKPNITKPPTDHTETKHPRHLTLPPSN